jgi:hypothetical protein
MSLFRLFQSDRSKALDAAEKAAHPILGVMEHFHGHPQRLWMDPYFLGFIGTWISENAKIATNGRISVEVQADVKLEVLKRITNLNPEAILSRTHELTVEKNDEFLDGMDRGLRIAAYYSGRLKDESNHPLVTKAEAMLAATGNRYTGDRRAAILGMMLFDVLEEIRSRFEKASEL